MAESGTDTITLRSRLTDFWSLLKGDELTLQGTTEIATPTDAEQTDDKTTETEEPIGLFALILGRSVAIIYSVFIAAATVIAASYGLLMMMGFNAPIAAAIGTGIVTLYINLTGFWDAAPKLFDDLFKGKLFKKKDKNGKAKDEKISRLSRIGLILFMLVLSTLTSAMIMAFSYALIKGALVTLGFGGLLFGGGVVLIPITVVGLLTYWVLYSADAGSIFGEQTPKSIYRSMKDYINPFTKDEDLLLPGEALEEVGNWMIARKVIRTLLILAMLGLIIYGTFGVGLLAAPPLLGYLGIAGLVPSGVITYLIVPMMVIGSSLYTMISTAHLATLMVVGMRYTLKQYFKPLEQIFPEFSEQSFGMRYLIGLMLSPVLIPSLFIDGIAGFFFAEGKFLQNAWIKSETMLKNNQYLSGLVFENSFEKARFKTSSTAFNVVANTILSIPLGLVYGVTRLVAGFGAFFNENKQILALVNAANNGAINTNPNKNAMEIALADVGGASGSAGFGFAKTENTIFAPNNSLTPLSYVYSLFNKNFSPNITAKNQQEASPPITTPAVTPENPPGTGKPVNFSWSANNPNATMEEFNGTRIITSYTGLPTQVNSVVSKVEGYLPTQLNDNQKLIDSAKALVQKAYSPGKQLNISGKNEELIKAAYCVCIANNIPYNTNPSTEIAKTALAAALKITNTEEYKISEFQTKSLLKNT